MSSPKSLTATTTAYTPLKESTRNAQTGGITPTSSWSTASSTSPLRISRRESPLTSHSIPNHHYHRLPTQLARRQSSSYNHVKNNNLVSKSPFKVSNGFRPSRIPTPSRVATNEDENKPDFGFKRRQSQGFRGLVKEQAVTNSPFLGHKRADSAPVPIPPPTPSRLPVSRSTSSPDVIEHRPSTPPQPSTPRNPRLADLSSMSPSQSPKSSLVSTKRLHGPRSLSASPTSESGRRQRRKTVTFDERCDVLEFDQDEVSEDAIETDIEEDDVYGSPELPSPAISMSTEGSFISDVGESSEPSLILPEDVPPLLLDIDDHTINHDMEQSGRTPRISRDEVRRRLKEQRAEEVQERNSFTLQQTPDIPSDISSQSMDVEPPLLMTDRPPDSDHSLNKTLEPPFDFNEPGVDLGEIHSALDRFMLGVERGFGLGPATRDSMDNERVIDSDISGSVNQSNVFSNVSSDGGVGVQRQDRSERHVKVEVAEIPEVLSADEDTDEPVTPPLVNHIDLNTPNSNKDDIMTHGAPSSGNSISAPPQGDLPGLMDASIVDLSTADIADDNGLEIQMSTPPRSPGKDQGPSAEPQLNLPGSLLSLSPLSSDPLSPITPGTVRQSSDYSSQAVPGFQFSKAVGRDASLVRSSSIISQDANPPPVPPKDPLSLQQRDDSVNSCSPGTRTGHVRERPMTYHEGRPSKRRSLSTGDAEDLTSNNPAAQRRAERLRDDQDLYLLDVLPEQESDQNDLANIIDQELKIRRKPTVKARNRNYQLRERENTIYASADDKVAHTSRAGDVDSGKAWRTVRRPSDMNEYSRQIKEFRSQQKPGKAHGKVFVKVLGVKGLNVPLPAEPTAFTCTLNNGIHFVTTPECRLSKDSAIEQEFELIEHSKLEFTLTLKVRRDSHITALSKAPAVPVGAASRPPSTSSRGVRSFFGVGGSPKKAQKAAVVPTARAPPEDNLARYLKPDGTLARAFVSFKEVADRCDTRLLQTSFSLIGQRTDGSSTTAHPWNMGEIVLQMFRLPPLPGIRSDQLPQSLEECLRGLRHVNWHKVTYHEGVLTQCGGDCRTWRRRFLRVIGSNLVAFNDVTKKATATIDLRKTIAVEDDDSPGAVTSPASAATARSRDEFDEVYRVERSFRLIFPDGDEISFFADSDQAKARWLEVFRALVGHIPPNPLWAELIWQRQEDLAKHPALSPSGSTSFAT